MFDLARHDRIAQGVGLAAGFRVGEAATKAVPDFDHGGGAAAHRPDGLVKAEIRRIDRASLDQLLPELKGLEADLIVEDAFNLIGGGVPEFAAEGPEDVIPGGLDHIACRWPSGRHSRCR